MNINSTGIQNRLLFRNGGATRRLGLGINMGTARLTVPSASAENADSASISRAARALLARENENKEKDYEELPEQQSQNLPRRHGLGTGQPNIRYENGERVQCLTPYLRAHPDCINSRFIMAFSHCRYTYFPERNQMSFTGLAQEYATIRQEFKDRYMGELLESRLAELTEKFESFLEEMADRAKNHIKWFASNHGQEGVERALKGLFGMKPSLGSDFNEGSANEIANMIRAFIMRMGLEARQFILENGTTEGFAENMKNSTNAFDGISSLFSPEDLASIRL